MHKTVMLTPDARCFACTRLATHLCASGEMLYDEDENNVVFEPEVKLACIDHAYVHARRNESEYVVTCPNCTCVFGV